MPQTILITGGCGFIGSNFIRMLIENEPDIHIINLDTLTYAGHKESLAGVMDDARHTFVHGDICDEDLVADLLKKHHVQGIINFAAESHVDRSISGPKPFIDTNIVGATNLLEQGLRAGIQRFMQVSTDEVYGSLGDEGLFTEDSALEPNSPYSASKTAADHLARAYFKTFGLDTVITRCSNNLGPYQFPEKLIPLMVTNARQDKPLPVYGDGLNVRDWIDVLDHCRGIWAAYSRGRAGEIYNIGASNERTNLQVVTAILDQLGKPHSLISFVEDRPGHDRRYAIDPTKANTELDWHAQYTFEASLERTIKWYQENQDWVRAVTREG